MSSDSDHKMSASDLRMPNQECNVGKQSPFEDRIEAALKSRFGELPQPSLAKGMPTTKGIPGKAK